MSDDPPVAEADDLRVELLFQLRLSGQTGELRGALTATNVGARIIMLRGKPEVVPLGLDGLALDAACIVPLEARIPGYVTLAPGERASNFVVWSGWRGPACSGRFRVSWSFDRGMEVVADGPKQPTREGPPTNLTTGWWERA